MEAFTQFRVTKLNFSKTLFLSDNYSMDKDAYIKQLKTENAELKKRIEELERLLGMNSMNSSKSPSSDPLGTSVILPKRRRKKRGARKGHEPHLRELLPQEFVKEHFHLKPEICICGSTNLEETSEEPLRHRFERLPTTK
jgi:hypothetical protein